MSVTWFDLPAEIKFMVFEYVYKDARITFPTRKVTRNNPVPPNQSQLLSPFLVSKGFASQQHLLEALVTSARVVVRSLDHPRMWNSSRSYQPTLIRQLYLRELYCESRTQDGYGSLMPRNRQRQFLAMAQQMPNLQLIRFEVLSPVDTYWLDSCGCLEVFGDGGDCLPREESWTPPKGTASEDLRNFACDGIDWWESRLPESGVEWVLNYAQSRDIEVVLASYITVSKLSCFWEFELETPEVSTRDFLLRFRFGGRTYEIPQDSFREARDASYKEFFALDKVQ